MTNPNPSQDRVEEQPTREQIAIQNVRAFAVFAHDKLPPHVSEDLLIVTKLAAESESVTVMREALEAIKELADADETFLCWKTANDALEALARIGRSV